MAAESTRAAKLAGLRRMLDELDANPLLPVPTERTSAHLSLRQASKGRCSQI